MLSVVWGVAGAAMAQTLTIEQLEQRVRALDPWFHNLDLNGIHTAPNHFLGDFPRILWRYVADALPDLTDRTVLDVGCNAGFYSLEAKRRGARRVVGIDIDPRYLEQAELAAQVLGQEIEFRQMSVYDVARMGEKFDLVIFMGVLYHLRHPLLALDLLREHVVGDRMIFQTMIRGGRGVLAVESDYPFGEEDVFDHPNFPKLHFVEHSYCGDATNWWIPNRASVEAMLRSSGFEIVDHPHAEVYVCQAAALPEEEARAVYPARGVED
jgi:tRNA (mo5U34)-methyltransferase